jgi:hypothetical protein
MGSFIQLLAENIGKVRPPILPITPKARSLPKMPADTSKDSPQASAARSGGETHPIA